MLLFSMEFVIESDDTTVRFWSSKRLPFQPKGTALDARNQLRQALSGLTPTGHLHATFASNDASFCDVENILLYNVGMSSFPKIGCDEVSLLREFRDPNPTSNNACFAYGHVYTTKVHKPQATSPTLCRRFALPDKVGVATVWYAARNLSEVSPSLRASNLGLRVHVGLPLSDKRKIHSILKVLLDGLVSSLHRHDGSHLEVVLPRLVNALGIPTPAIEAKLMTGPAELGVRPLIHPFISGVQWNPADEIFTQIVVSRHLADSPTCTFEVYEA